MISKVMAGDQFNLLAKSWYRRNTGATVDNAPFTATELLQSFVGLGGGNNPAAQHGATPGLLTGNTTGTLNPVGVLSNSNAPGSNNVKAGLCYILFDEQFKYVSGGYDPVNANDTGGLKAHLLQQVTVPKNGYLYVYCSNESKLDVFFDNLEVIHNRDALLEETHYYPFGLTMAGISSKAAGKLANNRKWNAGSELNTDFDISLYETFYRGLDPQTGRFLQVDPETDAQENCSPYESMGGNPISNVDPLGDFKTRFGAWWNRLWHGGERIGKNEYGEWYVTKNEGITVSSDGAVTAKSSYYYGKGRNKYSTAAEAILKDMEIMEDIRMNGENSMYKMYDSPEEAGRATLSYSGLLLPNPILRVTTNTVNAVKTVNAGQKIIARISKTLSIQKQARHLNLTAKQGGGYLNTINDAQKVLDAVHSGEAIFLGVNKAGNPVFRYSGVTGTNVNIGAGISGQPTNVFIVKGTTSPSIVPTSPAWLQ